jgi:hypothetical protein
MPKRGNPGGARGAATGLGRGIFGRTTPTKPKSTTRNTRDAKRMGAEGPKHAKPGGPNQKPKSSTTRGKHQAPTSKERIAAGRRKVNANKNPFLFNDSGMLRQPGSMPRKTITRQKRDAARAAGKNPFAISSVGKGKGGKGTSGRSR